MQFRKSKNVLTIAGRRLPEFIHRMNSLHPMNRKGWD
jgi:hypothetical protein